MCGSEAVSELLVATDEEEYEVAMVCKAAVGPPPGDWPEPERIVIGCVGGVF